MPADGVPSPELLAAMRREIAEHVEGVYSAEMRVLKRRVDALESIVLGQAVAKPTDALGKEGTDPPSVVEDALPSERSVGLRESNAYRPLIQHRLQSMADEELEGPPDSLPESLFNYCVERLSLSDKPWRDHAAGLLFLLMLSQNLLMNGFSQMNFKAMILLHWEPADQRPKMLMDCVYSDITFMGEPVLFLLVVLVALVIVALTIKADTESSLLVMYPDRSSKFGVWCFVNFVWFQKLVFVPGIFAVEASALFANSADTTALIMNTLAVSFILDVDNLLYCSILSDGQKSAYQALAGREGRPKRTLRMSQSSWLLFWCGMLQMCIHFFAIRVVLDALYAKDFISGTLPLYLTYVIGCGLRGAVQVWATRPDGLLGLSDVAVFLLCAVAAPVWFFSFAKMTIGSNDPMFKVGCFEESELR